MSVNCTSLGKRISFYRSKSNLSQEALAAKINCSREHIVRIENGTKIPSISVLVEIANTLSVSADELLLDCLESMPWTVTTTLFPNIFGSHAKNAGPSAWMCTTSYFPNAL